MRGRSEKIKARETDESTSVWWWVWESFKSLLVNKPVFSPADKMQKYFRNFWPFLSLHSGKLWEIFIPWVLRSDSSSGSPLLKTIFCPDLCSSLPVIFCLLRHFSRKKSLRFQGYNSICKNKQALPLLVHLLRYFIYSKDLLSLPNEIM